MAGRDENLLKIYDETASLLADLSLRGQIEAAEMYFLLSLLDQVVVKGGHPRLMDALRQWRPEALDPELNEIIKATLLALNFQDQEALANAAQMIEDLVESQE